MYRYLVVLASALLMACSEPSKDISQRDTPISLSLITGVQPGFGLVKVSQEQGLFEKHNIELHVIDRPSGKLALKSVINQEVDPDFILVADIAFLANQHRLSNYRIVASVFDSDNQNALASLAPINDLSALKGKTMCTQHQSALHFYGQLLVEYSGEKDVTFKYLNISDLVTGLYEGECDFITIREPFISQIKKAPPKPVYIQQFAGIYLQHELMLANERVSSKDVARVLTTLIEAEKLFISDEEKVISTLSKSLSATPKSMKSLKEDSMWEVSLYRPLVPLLERQMSWLVDLGIEEGRGFVPMLALRTESLESIAPLKQTVVTNED